MNQWQFDEDGDGSYDPEEFFDFRGNPIRALFDQPPMNLYEKSYLKWYLTKHRVVDDNYELA